MNDSDFKIFSEAWMDAHEIMPGGKVLSSGAMTMCFDALSRFPLDVVLLAIKRHVEIGKFAPIPKDIIDILESHNAHIGADEAWGIVVESMDEEATVVMTNEMSEARSFALPVWQSGDEVGARMSFRETYNRIIKTAPKPQWFVSAGWDKDRRFEAVKKAVQMGRLTHDKVKHHYLEYTDSGPIGKLLTGKVTEMPDNKKLQKRWSEMKVALQEGQIRLAEKERQSKEESEKKRIAFEESRKKAVDLIEKMKDEA